MAQIVGIDHIYLSVADLARSEAFYDRAMGVLGFRKNRFEIGGAPHVQYYNRHFGLVLRPARPAPAHDPYAPGLHHLCLRVDGIGDVHAASDALRAAGIEATAAALHADYAPDYWATFFTDPDGIRLEITNYRQERRDRHDHWDRGGEPPSRANTDNRPMNTSALCAGGPAISDVVAGCWRLVEWGWSAAETARWIEGCVELGITGFDHADIYGDYSVEARFGEALAAAPGLRERIRIVTKCGIRLLSPARPGHRLKSYDASAAHIVASAEASLQAFGTDRIDLLLLHRPDALMQPDEVAGAFDRLRRDGKVLHFGVSNFSPSQFELLDAATPLATNQIELHPLHRTPLHDGTLDQALRLKRRPMIWSPLAGGRLLGGDESAPAQRVRWVLGEIGARLGVSPATVAYAWARRHPSQPVLLVGSRRLEAMREAADAAAITLDREDWTALWQAGAGHELA